jgi:hypothetical protein
MSTEITSILEEIDFPVPIDPKKSKNWIYNLKEDESSVRNAIDKLFNGKIDSLRKKTDLLKKLGIFGLLMAYTVLTVIILEIVINATLQRDQLFSGSINVYIEILILLTITLIGISVGGIHTFLILNLGILPEPDIYIFKCLKYRNEDDYIVMKSQKEFYLKKVDFDWSLNNIFYIDTKRFLLYSSSVVLIGSIGFLEILVNVSSKLIEPDSYQPDEIIFFYGIIVVISIIILCILGVELVRNSYDYYYVKNQVLEIVEERILFIDSILSKGQPLDEIDFIKGLVVQNKLNRVRTNLKKMPAIPLTYRKVVVSSIISLSLLYSLIVIILNQVTYLIS